LKVKAKEGLKYYRAESFGIEQKEFDKLIVGEVGDISETVFIRYPNLFDALSSDKLKTEISAKGKVKDGD
jgi:hypothetical protein